jgi:hypothetical protein
MRFFLPRAVMIDRGTSGGDCPASAPVLKNSVEFQNSSDSDLAVDPLLKLIRIF